MIEVVFKESRAVHAGKEGASAPATQADEEAGAGFADGWMDREELIQDDKIFSLSCLVGHPSIRKQSCGVMRATIRPLI